MGKIRVAVVDDHAVVRMGLKFALATLDDIEFAGEHGDGEDAAKFVRELKPDVTLLDIRMPKKDGIEALEEILDANPEAKVVMLTTSSTEEDIYRSLKLGAKGYVLKDRDPQNIVDAIRLVAAGDSYIPDEVRELYEIRSKEPELTPRENETLQLLVSGKCNREIAAALGEKYPDVTPRDGTEHVTDAYYYGSLGRSANSYNYKDRFVFFDYDLPEHETTVLRCKMKSGNPAEKDPNGRTYYGSAVPCKENYQKYFDGTFNTNETFDHYVNFFPICDKVVYPENTTGRKALFIGDSFSLGLQELIASHFDETYYFYADGTVDLWKGQDFADTCEEYGITDVIIVEQSTRILYDFYDYSGPALCSFRVSR